MDGDRICVTTDHFENLQESPAIFLLTDSYLGRKISKYTQGGTGIEKRALRGEHDDYAILRALYDVLAGQMEDLDCPNWGCIERGPLKGHYAPCGNCEGCEVREWVS